MSFTETEDGATRWKCPCGARDHHSCICAKIPAEKPDPSQWKHVRLTKRHGTSECLGWDGSWYSLDGGIEVRPAYAPSIRGGSCVRRTHWIIISAEKTMSASDLESAKSHIAWIYQRRYRTIRFGELDQRTLRDLTTIASDLGIDPNGVSKPDLIQHILRAELNQ